MNVVHPRLAAQQRTAPLCAAATTLTALVTAANVQERDGGVLLVATLFGQFPFLRKLFADSAYSGPIFQGGVAAIMANLEIEIVKRCDSTKGFVVERNDGLLSAPSPGSTAVGGSPRTGKIAATTRLRSSISLPFGSCSESSVIPYEVCGRTLTK